MIPTLTTSRLVIRKATLDDASFVFTLLNDPDWLHFIGDRQIHDLDAARAYINKILLLSYHTHELGLQVVTLGTTQEPMGLCGLIQREGLADPDLGFAFLPEYRGQGYAFEAARSVLDFYRCERNLTRVVAITLPDNTASKALLDSLGFDVEQCVQLEEEAEELLQYALHW